MIKRKGYTMDYYLVNDDLVLCGDCFDNNSQTEAAEAGCEFRRMDNSEEFRFECGDCRTLQVNELDPDDEDNAQPGIYLRGGIVLPLEVN